MIEANTTQPVHGPLSPLDGLLRGACVLVISRPVSAEDLVLLGSELLLGEDAVVAQLGELAELLDRIGPLVDRHLLRRRRRLGLVAVARRGSAFLRGPA